MNAPTMQTSAENTIEQTQSKRPNQSNEMIVIIRPSFMKFCQDGCRAAALNHILFWIAQKAKGQPINLIQNGEVSWYSSNEEITKCLMGWGGCKVRIEVNHLIDMGILGQSKGHKWGSGNRAKHFIFSKEHCATLLNVCQEHNINILQIGLCDTVLRLIQATTTNEVLIAAIQKMLTTSKYRDIQAVIPSRTSSEIREPHSLVSEITTSKYRESKTKGYSKVTSKDYSRSTASKSKTEENDNNGSSISQFSSEEKSIWSSICQAKGVTRNPTRRERGQITELAKLINSNKLPIEEFTATFISEMWQHALTAKSYLQADPDWKVGNIIAEFPDYLVSRQKTTPRIATTSGMVTFRADTADYLRESAKLQQCSEEEAITAVQQRYEHSSLSVDQFDELVVRAIMTVACHTHTSGSDWLQHLTSIVDKKSTKHPVTVEE